MAAPLPARNARQRKSAKRSARHHAVKRWRVQALTVLFSVRLRRRVRLRRDLADLDELSDEPSDVLPDVLSAKRGRGSSSSSAADCSSSAASSDLDEEIAGRVRGAAAQARSGKARVAQIARRFEGYAPEPALR